MEANYPWEGEIKIKVEPEAASEFRLKIRIPGWAKGNLLRRDLYGYLNNDKRGEGFVIKVNGEIFEKPEMVNGYVVIDRSWEKGDYVELSLPMDVKYVTGNPKIEDTHSKTVLMRGPLVYCLEEFDNNAFFDVNRKPNVIPDTFKPEFDEKLLNGVVKLKGQGSQFGTDAKFDITAVPYYAWNNRGKGQMKVWLPFLKH